MPTTRRAVAPTPTRWPRLIRDEVWQLEDGRTLEHGMEVHTSALRGRWRFLAHVTAREVDWLDVYGPLGSRKPRVRSIAPESVTTIHRTTTPKRVDRAVGVL